MLGGRNNEAGEPPSGLLMMLRSFGIDPKVMVQSVQQISALLSELNQRLARVETELTRVAESQERIESAIRVKGGHA